MFERLFAKPYVVARQRAAPLVEERLRYLTHLAAQGISHTTLKEVAYFTAAVVQVLRLAERPGEVIHSIEIDQQAHRWHQKAGSRKKARSLRGIQLFCRYAKQWLQFLGRFQPPLQPPHPDAELIAAFCDWLRSEKGLVPENLGSHRTTVSAFLSQLRFAKRSLKMVTLPQVEEAFTSIITAKDYRRASVQRMAGNLRTFLRYAETRGLCQAGVSVAIWIPRVFTDETLPYGPTWGQVQELLGLVKGDRPDDIRDRAILLLLAVYGLRAGELVQLRLEDFDWEREQLVVRRPKTMRTQTLPLSCTVATAVVRYLKEVRSKTTLRNLFLARRAPVRPIHRSTVYLIVSRRLRVVCPLLPRHGPHSLRHACATHLLEEGQSLKVIGDYLGHRHPESTRIYTKVDLPCLRKVANFDLGGLL